MEINIDILMQVMTWVSVLMGLSAFYLNIKIKKQAFYVWMFMDILNVAIYWYYGVYPKILPNVIYFALGIKGIIFRNQKEQEEKTDTSL